MKLVCLSTNSWKKKRQAHQLHIFHCWHWFCTYF